MGTISVFITDNHQFQGSLEQEDLIESYHYLKADACKTIYLILVSLVASGSRH